MFDNLAALDAQGIASEADLTAEELIARANKLLAIGRELQLAAAQLRGEPAPKAISRPAGPSDDHSVGRLGNVDEDAATAKAREMGTFTRTAFGDALGFSGVQTTKWLMKLVEHGVIAREIDEDGAIVFRYARTLDDEPPIYQLRAWCASNREPFDVAAAEEATGLTREEVTAAISNLVRSCELKPTVVESVNELDEIEKLTGQFFEWTAPIPNGLQSELERRRLAAVLPTPEVKRGLPIRIRTERSQRRARSTPGNRQKVINQDRNWQRLQDAQAARAAQAKTREAKPPKHARTKKASKPV